MQTCHSHRLLLLAFSFALFLGCGALEDELTIRQQALSSPASGKDPLHASSEAKPPVDPAEKPVIIEPDPKERAAIIAKQQIYLKAVATKLATEWKGLTDEQNKKEKAALKLQIMEGGQ